MNEIYISYSMSIMTYIISYLIDILRVIVGGGFFLFSTKVIFGVCTLHTIIKKPDGRNSFGIVICPNILPVSVLTHK